MRRIALAATAAALLLAPAAASAATPTLGPVSAPTVKPTTAVLEGSVDPHGEASTYYFQYTTSGPSFNLTSTVFQTTSATTAAVEGPQTVSAPVIHLAPNTLYHYRLVASNSSGKAVGEESEGTAGSFETPPAEGFAAEAVIRTQAVIGGQLQAPVFHPAIQAGSHPADVAFADGLDRGSLPAGSFPGKDIRGLRLELPVGMIVNSQAAPLCGDSTFGFNRVSPYEPSASGESCADRTQIGVAQVERSTETRTFGIFNLAPKPGDIGRFGMAPFGYAVTFDIRLQRNADGTYSTILEAKGLNQALNAHGLHLDFWGVPWDHIHDRERGNCLNEVDPGKSWGICPAANIIEGEPANEKPEPVFSLPTRCEGPLPFVATGTTSIGTTTTATVDNPDFEGDPAQMECKYLQFNPAVVGHLTNTRTSSPSGFVFRFDADQSRLLDPEFAINAAPRTAVVQPPQGTTINPAVAEGLGYCTPAQYAAETLAAGGCPAAARIGDFRVDSPLFDGTITGGVYLAQPDDPATSTPGAENPFDRMVAVYVVGRLQERGVFVKLPGYVDLDPGDGTVRGHFQELPEFPYTDLEITFRAGERSFLVTPPACGYLATDIDMTGWGSAEPQSAVSYSLVNKGYDSGACPEGLPPFAPVLHAHETNPQTNAFTPYFVNLTRKDTEQEITGYSIVLPQGVTGKLAGVTPCSDAAIEAARGRSGFAEAADPSCPSAGQVGHVSVGFGVGSELTFTTGRVYLAGPHDGAPLSLVTIVPATLGPFNLGTVVIRSAFHVDPRTARLSMDVAASDTIPHIRDGVVLHLREIHFELDRPEFTHNPSNCLPSEVLSTLHGSGPTYTSSLDDSTVTVSEKFQLLNCGAIPFQPKMGIRLRGATRRGGYPQLRVAYFSREGDANLRQIGVAIPGQEFLAQEHIRSICTKPQFVAEQCPASSVYGSAVAYTPMLDQPLRGNIYLRSSSHALPDLVADLHSGAVRIILEGRIGPGKTGGVRAFFKDLPDQPLGKFVMKLYGGKRGLLLNSASICQKPPVSNGKAIGQNGATAYFLVKLRGRCGGKHRKHHHAHHGKHHRKPHVIGNRTKGHGGNE